MADRGTEARRAALRLLQEVMAEGRLLPELASVTARLDPADRARAQRLATAVLRGLGRADRLLAPHLSKRPALYVLNALRLGVTELAAGEAPHGVVSDLVNIVAADRRHASLKGLVNAVLRKCATTAPEGWAALPPPAMPDWLRRPLVAAWGKPAIAAIEAVQARVPPLDLTPRGDAAALAAATGGTVLPTGSVRLTGAAQVSTLPGYDAGAWWVQDAAAAIPARILAARPGERVLDLCAAPGGKTLQLAAAGAEVTAVDLSRPRLKRVEENLARCRLSARIVAADALKWEPEAEFDAILLDAPCSASGTIRRHPDLPHLKRDLGALTRLQAALLARAWDWLAPGGRLVYAVCSILPAEGEDQAAAFAARGDVARLAIDPATLGAPEGWVDAAGALRLRPDFWAERGAIDGFYAALFARRLDAGGE